MSTIFHAWLGTLLPVISQSWGTPCAVIKNSLYYNYGFNFSHVSTLEIYFHKTATN
ncbi:MAG: hypothetical protein ACFFFT_09010 [Candidatus Thorarchaeota archaeon]